MNEPIITFLTKAEEAELKRLTEVLFSTGVSDMTGKEIAKLNDLQNRKTIYLKTAIELVKNITANVTLT